MTVYLLHLDQPLSRGTSPAGKPLTAGHYIGWTDDLVGRLLAHDDTVWEPLEQPETTEDGGVRRGKKQGHGSSFIGFVNYMGIGYRLARTWDGETADRALERRLKNAKIAPRLCPICNPEEAMRFYNLQPSYEKAQRAQRYRGMPRKERVNNEQHGA